MSFIDWRGHAWLALAARLYLGGIFLFAAAHKVWDPAGFALDVATYDILPLELVNLQAIILPWVEVVAALLLLVCGAVLARRHPELMRLQWPDER